MWLNWGHEGGLARPGVVPKRLRPFHQHLLHVRPEDLHRLLDELGEWHRPGLVGAVVQVGLDPRWSNFEDLHRRALQLVAQGQCVRMQGGLR